MSRDEYGMIHVVDDSDLTFAELVADATEGGLWIGWGFNDDAEFEVRIRTSGNETVAVAEMGDGRLAATQAVFHVACMLMRDLPLAIRNTYAARFVTNVTSEHDHGAT